MMQDGPFQAYRLKPGTWLAGAEPPNLRVGYWDSTNESLGVVDLGIAQDLLLMTLLDNLTKSHNGNPVTQQYIKAPYFILCLVL